MKKLGPDYAPVKSLFNELFCGVLSGLLPDVPHLIINIYFVLKSLNLSSVIQFHSSPLELARLRDSHTTECALQIEMWGTRQRKLNCHSSHPPGWRCLRFICVLAAITLNWANFILSPRQSASSLISADSFLHCSLFATWVGLSFTTSPLLQCWLEKIKTERNRERRLRGAQQTLRSPQEAVQADGQAGRFCLWHQGHWP